jgi:hypothetical protein
MTEFCMANLALANVALGRTTVAFKTKRPNYQTINTTQWKFRKPILSQPNPVYRLTPYTNRINTVADHKH